MIKRVLKECKKIFTLTNENFKKVELLRKQNSIVFEHYDITEIAKKCNFENHLINWFKKECNSICFKNSECTVQYDNKNKCFILNGFYIDYIEVGHELA